jgi:hypothetical protein
LSNYYDQIPESQSMPMDNPQWVTTFI